jgi:hypothetical protein
VSRLGETIAQRRRSDHAPYRYDIGATGSRGKLHYVVEAVLTESRDSQALVGSASADTRTLVARALGPVRDSSRRGCHYAGESPLLHR